MKVYLIYNFVFYNSLITDSGLLTADCCLVIIWKILAFFGFMLVDSYFFISFRFCISHLCISVDKFEGLARFSAVFSDLPQCSHFSSFFLVSLSFLFVFSFFSLSLPFLFLSFRRLRRVWGTNIINPLSTFLQNDSIMIISSIALLTLVSDPSNFPMVSLRSRVLSVCVCCPY